MAENSQPEPHGQDGHEEVPFELKVECPEICHQHCIVPISTARVIGSFELSKMAEHWREQTEEPLAGKVTLNCRQGPNENGYCSAMIRIVLENLNGRELDVTNTNLGSKR